jgi:hypothetical protein
MAVAIPCHIRSSATDSSALFIIQHDPSLKLNKISPILRLSRLKFKTLYHPATRA